MQAGLVWVRIGNENFADVDKCIKRLPFLSISIPQTDLKPYILCMQWMNTSLSLHVDFTLWSCEMREPEQAFWKRKNWKVCQCCWIDVDADGKESLGGCTYCWMLYAQDDYVFSFWIHCKMSCERVRVDN